MYPAILKNALNHFKKPSKFIEILKRSDYLYPITKPKQAFFADSNYNPVLIKDSKSIVVLPLPTLNRFSYSFWHTLLFLFSKERGLSILQKYLKEYDNFYYLMNPADLIDLSDLPKKNNHSFERMNINIHIKTNLVNSVFELFEQTKTPIITMEEIAINFIKSSLDKK